MGCQLHIVVLGMVFALLLGPRAPQARTWHIKPDGTGDAPTIQAAMDSAQAGDEVVLASGSYTWTTQGASGRDMILVKADVTLRSEAGDPEAVILDAEQRGRVIRCLDVRSARIEALTIRGGEPRFPSYSQGAGIYSSGNSQPTISNCIIRNNKGYDPYYGGGIFCENATIERCQVLENSISGQQAIGGGIFCRYTQVTDCLIRDNQAVAFNGACSAGGVLASFSTLTDCVIENNWARSVFGAVGGGVSLYYGTMRDCILISNRASANYSGEGEGGGVYGGYSDVSNCVFLGNSAIG